MSGDHAMSETGSGSDECVEGGDLDEDAEVWKGGMSGEDQLM